jgi:hypothetical protein
MIRRALTVTLAAAALSGCGLGAAEGGATGVELTVTRDFGQSAVAERSIDSVPQGETVMRVLQRSFEVRTRYGGGFVQAIEGLTGGASGGRQVDWFFYVNGIESEEGAAARAVAEGDRIWWDHHDWSTAMRVPAVVGSFPEPFRTGSEGKRRPVRIDCASDERRHCDEVRRRLEAAGVQGIATAGFGAASGAEVLRILVGTWSEIRGDHAAQQLERGPEASGVFARPDSGGASIDLLDVRGRTAETVRAGAGLVAATRYEDQQPTWVVTGTDEAGVASAAAALDEAVLKQRFAVAVADGVGVALPWTRDDARRPAP